jgi:hypothetical protein
MTEGYGSIKKLFNTNFQFLLGIKIANKIRIELTCSLNLTFIM